MSIFNDAAEPFELIKWFYQKLFHLSAIQMADEPVDKVYLAISIQSMINKKKALEMKHTGK